MTKMEFAIKLEKYNKKQRVNMWAYLILGIVFIVFAFTPSITLYLNENNLGFTTSFLAVLGGLFLGKSGEIKRGTEEDELLINALDLLSRSNDT